MTAVIESKKAIIANNGCGRVRALNQRNTLCRGYYPFVGFRNETPTRIIHSQEKTAANLEQLEDVLTVATIHDNYGNTFSKTVCLG